MSRGRRALAALGALPALLLGLVSPGCGWRAGLEPAELWDVSEDATVGVEIFRTDRNVIERQLEARLSESLTAAVNDLVHARLVTPGRADLVLRGEILEYRRRGGIRSRENRLLESGVQLTLRAELVDAAGRVLSGPVDRRVWSGYSLGAPLEPFDPGSPTAPRDPVAFVDGPANEDRAADRALRHLAETLVLELFRPADESEAKNPGAGE